jgi:hypothetical protein
MADPRQVNKIVATFEDGRTVTIERGSKINVIFAVDIGVGYACVVSGKTINLIEVYYRIGCEHPEFIAGAAVLAEMDARERQRKPAPNGATEALANTPVPGKEDSSWN